MSDRAVAGIAAATALAAWWSQRAPVVIGAAPVLIAALAIIVGGRIIERPAALGLGVVVLVCVLGVRAWAGLGPPPAGARCSGVATVVEDPVPLAGGTAVVLSCDGRRIQAVVHGALASAARAALAGDRLEVDGRLGAVSARDATYLWPRHVSAVVTLTRLVPRDGGRAWWRVANAVRRRVHTGDVGLGPDRAALFEGIVLGDDRAEAPTTKADFAGAGLAHLTAVSGQNLAFALAAAAPALRRLRLGPRAVASLGCIAGFCVLVRFEPSVLRAAAMLSIVIVARSVGTPVGGVRVVGLAVVACLLVDPLLVHRLGFALSVAASLGLALMARPIAARLWGPRALRDLVAASLAAQIATAPVLMLSGLSGGPSLPSLAANVLAVPVAGPLTAWGLVGGPVAGVMPPTVATVLHLPTRAMVGWIATVASHAARLPGTHASTAVTALGIVGAAVALVAGRNTPARVVGLAVVLIACVVVPLRAPVPDLAGVAIAPSATAWRTTDGTILVLAARPDAARVLKGLDAAAITDVELVVITAGGRPSLATVAALVARGAAHRVAGPPRVNIAGIETLVPGTALRSARLVVVVAGTSERPTVRVMPAAAATDIGG